MAHMLCKAVSKSESVLSLHLSGNERVKGIVNQLRQTFGVKIDRGDTFQLAHSTVINKKTKPEKDILRKLGIETIVPHKGSEEIQFPETLEGFQLDIDSEMKKFKGDDSQELSPDAEKEIMEAIGEAKGNNKTGFLNNIKQKLMATRSKRAETEAKVYDNASQQAAFASDMEKIQGKIGEARTALMDFNH